MTKARDLARVGSNAEYGLNFRNKIINGDMRIDQRNAGASVTASDTSIEKYVTDRWGYRVLAANKMSLQQVADGPSGFVNSLKVTSSSAYTVGSDEFLNVMQIIEGTNIADLAWGTAAAKTVTVSFWVKSSLTGTFGGVLLNAASDRTYVFTYSINAANTWEYKTITIAGPTSGTWLTTTGRGIYLSFSMGSGSSFNGATGWQNTTYLNATGATSLVGTNGATWQITGVQLEVGASATPFETRPYGTELALCQRYYQTLSSYPQMPVGTFNWDLSTSALITIVTATTMRAIPSYTNSVGTLRYAGNNVSPTTYVVNSVGNNRVSISATGASGTINDSGVFCTSTSASLSAEL